MYFLVIADGHETSMTTKNEEAATRFHAHLEGLGLTAYLHSVMENQISTRFDLNKEEVTMFDDWGSTLNADFYEKRNTGEKRVQLFLDSEDRLMVDSLEETENLVDVPVKQLIEFCRTVLKLKGGELNE